MVHDTCEGPDTFLQDWLDQRYPDVGAFCRWFNKNIARFVTFWVFLAGSIGFTVLFAVSFVDSCLNTKKVCAAMAISYFLTVMALHFCFRRKTVSNHLRQETR